MSIDALICTPALVLVALVALAKVKEMDRGQHWCERLAYGFIFGGSLGSAAEWWPTFFARWGIQITTYHADTVFIFGCGLLAFSVILRRIYDANTVLCEELSIHVPERRRDPR